MRIGIIAHLKYPIAEPFAGGLEMHTHLLAGKLQQRGHSVKLYTCEGSNAKGAVAVCSATTPRESTEIAYQISEAREHRAYLRVMDEVRGEKFDIVHNNSLHYLPLAMADLVDAPMLTTLHTPPFDPLTNAVKAAADVNHVLVGVSETISMTWAKAGIECEVVPNGVDLSCFSMADIADKPAYAIWYGRIVPEKGLHYAIAASKFAGLPLRIAGPISDPEYFKTYIAGQLDSRTLYEGHLTHAKLRKLIAGASVSLCTPCWDEPYGLVVAESLACGVPVAAFARGAIPIILDDESGVLATPGNTKSLADAALKAKMFNRLACRARAEKICDAELMVDRYIDLYARLAGQLPDLDIGALPPLSPG